MSLVFALIRAAKIHRVPPSVELAGMDASKHGGVLSGYRSSKPEKQQQKSTECGVASTTDGKTHPLDP